MMLLLDLLTTAAMLFVVTTGLTIAVLAALTLRIRPKEFCHD